MTKTDTMKTMLRFWKSAPTLFLCFLTLTPFFSAHADQAKFEARVTTTHLSPEDSLQVDFVLTTQGAKDVGEIQFPAFDGWTVVSRSQRTGVSFNLGGGTSSKEETVIYSFTLTPEKEGLLKLNSASVIVDGKTFETNTVSIRVDRQAPQQSRSAAPDPFQELEDMQQHLFNRLLRRAPAPQLPEPEHDEALPDANFAAPKGRFFLKAVPSKQKVYKGQTFSVKYYLYIDANSGLQALDVTQWPTNQGFLVQEQKTPGDLSQMKWETQRIGDRTYRRTVLLEYRVSPLKEGKRKIVPLKIKAQLVTSNAGGWGLPQRLAPMPAASAEESMEVLPLPTPVPKDFLGAVGRFTLEAVPPPAQTKTNQALTFRLIVKGQGSFESIDSLPFSPPANVELFDTRTEPTAQQKAFEYILIPRQPGEYKLPPVRLTYFDPEKGQYEHSETKVFTFKAEGEAAAPGTPITSLPGTAPSSPTLSATPPVYTSLASTRWQPILAFASWGMFLLLGLGKGLRQLRKRRPEKRLQQRPLTEMSRRWAKQYPQSPPPKVIEDIRFHIVTELAQSLSGGTAIQISKNRSVEEQLEALGKWGLLPEKMRLAENLLRELQSLAFSQKEKSERLQLWNQLLEQMKQL